MRDLVCSLLNTHFGERPLKKRLGTLFKMWTFWNTIKRRSLKLGSRPYLLEGQ